MKDDALAKSAAFLISSKVGSCGVPSNPNIILRRIDLPNSFGS